LRETSTTAWIRLYGDVPDMPVEDCAPIYHKVEAERAWSKLLALYKTLP
jgi:hypothetical protein